MSPMERIVVLAMVCALGACGSKGGGEPAGVNVGKTCDAANDGKTVTVIGYLSTPLMAGVCGDTCSVDLAETREYTNKTLTLLVPAGTGPMTMKPLPTDLQFLQEIGADAFTVVDSDGKEQRVGERLRVTGTLEAKHRVMEAQYGNPRIEYLDCNLRPATIHPF
jgi:hypothetical protein